MLQAQVGNFMKMNNTTAINKFRGTVSQELNHLTKDLRFSCLNRHKATHWQGFRTSQQTKSHDRTDWMYVPESSIK